MIQLSIRYAAEMENGEYLFTMYDDTGYSAFSVTDFADANLYRSLDDPHLAKELEDIQKGITRFEMGSPIFKQMVKVELKTK